jgi:hypothetical protein
MPQKNLKPWEVPIQASPTMPDMSLVQRLFGHNPFARRTPDILLPFTPGQDEIDSRLLQLGSSGNLVDRLKFGQGMLKALGAKKERK